MEVNHKDRAHSELGASSAKRWLACPSSVHLSENIPDTYSPYAAEGTCAHELSEIAITEGKPCSDYIGNTYEGFVVTEEMAQYVQLYVDYVNNASEGKELSIEERVSLAHIDPRMFGSNDAIIYEPYGTLEVIDLKYGRGVVEAENNPQLLYYALGASVGGDYQQVKMTIVQPRVEDPIKSWTVPIEYLEEFEAELRAGVERVDSKDELFEIGDHCHFCKAKPVCPAKKRKAQEVARMDFADVMPKKETSLPAPSDLTDVELVNILNHANSVTDWIKSVEGYALGQLERGRKIEGYKLVEGKSTRYIEDTEKFIAENEMFYGDAIYKPRSLEGIGKLAKLIGKKELEKYLVKPEGKHTIVPESDKREAVTPAIEADFAEFINNEPSFDDMEF